uniref:Protein diaphanous (inferred by orthology to a D. melanogaster protein) n=1 Tax=Anisakis simplex TaxID=6269 RepID=A0A0M3KGX5_ANISI
LRIGGGPPAPPPPPPLPGMKGPPPPPPLGMSKSAPATPEIPEYLKRKAQRSVDVPLKKIAWSSATIKPTQIAKDSFWAQTSEEKFANERLFETLKMKFATSRPALPTNDSELAKTANSKSLSKKKVKMPLVINDDKVLQALAILQGSCKLSLREWKRCLLEVDDKTLDAGTMQQLRTALPPIEMLNKLRELPEKKFSEMPEGEQFAATLASIKALPARLDSIVFMLRFNETLNDLKPGISAVIEACDEIRTSAGFAIFLQMVLLVGNYMGHSSKTYKDAFGFEMTILTKVRMCCFCD